MYEKDFIIQSIDVDEFARLKLSALFKYIQIIAGEAIESSGIGQEALMNEGLLWVLTRIKVTLKVWPKWQDKITIKTYPNDNIKFIYPRHFIIYDNNNNEIMRVVSTWSLISAKERRLAIYDLKNFKNFIVEKYHDELPLPSKIVLKDTPSFCYSHTVRYTDCDINRHLNNTRYIDLILDVNHSSFYKEKEIVGFQIQYESELLEGQTIDIFTYCENNYQYVLGKKGELVSFLSLIEYKER